MKWFMNLSIQAKLLATFIIVAVFLLLLGILGYYGTLKSDGANSEMFAHQFRMAKTLDESILLIVEIQSDVQMYFSGSTPGDRRRSLEMIEGRIKVVDELIDQYCQLETDPEFAGLQKDLTASWSALKRGLTDITAPGPKIADTKGLSARFTDCRTKLEILNQRNEMKLAGTASSTSLMTRWILTAILILVAIGVVFAALIGTKLAGSIRTSIGKLVTAAGALAAGDVKTRLEVTATNELGQLAQSFNTLAENLDRQAAEAEQISLGNLNVGVRERSDKDLLSKSRGHVVTILRSLLDETNSLLRSAREGRLDIRGDSRRFSGGYREIIDGVNKTLDAVVTPLKESSDILSVMATGDLTGRVEGEYHGDHEIMKKSVNELAESLTSALRDVAEVVTATASSSTEISSSIEEMAAGAQNQSLQTAEIAGAIEEMTATIHENSKNAGQALDTAKRASQVAQDGGKVVLETVEYMNRIADVVKKSAGTVQTLGRSSDQIGEIIQVIEDIADQTNLLALNAAIEAARAGEQGRGFAVVADEVRKLAERTTKATKEISRMIKQIQGDTTGAVKSMEEGTKEVDLGIELAHKAGVSLDVIVTVVAQLTEMATQIAAGSEQQSSAAEQISKNIEAIRNVTHEYAGGIQEMARATSDLNKLMEQLQRLILQFKIDEVKSTARRTALKKTA